MTLTFSIFGEHEWSVRLGALIPSFLSLLLVTAIAWRRLGPLAGATAALVFAVVPVNIWYSVNIDQGFPSIACLLGFFWFYLRWLDTGRWSLGITALGLELLAGGFEWSPYFAFPAIFAHVVWIAIKRKGRFRIFAALHPLVVVLPLALHFGMVWRAGMLNDLLGAYRNRAADVTYDAFVLVMRQYGATLFGRVLMTVMVVWLVLTLVRLLRGQGKAIDLVGLTFAFALVTYVHVFKVAVITHAYRQLYANVWAAWAVADLAVRAQKTTTALLLRRSRHAAGAASAASAARAARAASVGCLVAVVGVTAVMLATVPVAWAGLIESRAHGGIPGWKTFNPDLRQTAFASEVNRATRPGDTIYFHHSFANPPPHRMDWAFYYDRDLRRDLPLRALQRLSPGDRGHAVAIVLPGSLSADELRAYAELALHHPVLHIDDLVMIDLRKDGPDTRALALAPVDRGHTGALRRWFEGPYPWPRLVPDVRLRAADEALVHSTLAAATAPPPAPRPGRRPISKAPAPPASIVAPVVAPGDSCGRARGHAPGRSRETEPFPRPHHTQTKTDPAPAPPTTEVGFGPNRRTPHGQLRLHRRATGVGPDRPRFHPQGDYPRRRATWTRRQFSRARSAKRPGRRAWSIVRCPRRTEVWACRACRTAWSSRSSRTAAWASTPRSPGTCWDRCRSSSPAATSRKRHYLGRLLAKPIFAAYCCSEPDAGSDVAGMKTRFRKVGNEYVLTGQKRWITNGGVADFYTVFARAEGTDRHKGITCFVVDRQTPGVSVGKKENKMGQRASNTTDVLFEDVKLGPGQRRRRRGRGFQAGDADIRSHATLDRGGGGGDHPPGAGGIARVRARPQDLWRAHRPAPGRPVHAGRHGDRVRIDAAARSQGGLVDRRGASRQRGVELREGLRRGRGHAGHHRCRTDFRRLRLHQGLSG